MVRINLLPHRQMARAERKHQLGLMTMLTVALGVVLVFMGHQVMQTRLDSQADRNKRIQGAIDKLDIEIEEIKGLKEEIKTMLDKKQVVENLQSNRSQAVVLLDEITRQLPEAVFLNSFKQNGNTITLQGYADSNGRVATLVRNLSTSRWLEAPALIEIHAAEINKQKMSNFTLTVKQKAPSNAAPVIQSGKDKKA
jgi:type IV pilus assembly protein PilN